MELIFNDGSTLEILSFVLDPLDKNVLDIHLETSKDRIDNVKQIFKNEDKISTLTCGEIELKRFTKLSRFYINALEDEIYDIDLQLIFEGISAEVDALKERLARSNEQLDMLSGCILELSDILYQ